MSPRLCVRHIHRLVPPAHRVRHTLCITGARPRAKQTGDGQTGTTETPYHAVRASPSSEHEAPRDTPTPRLGRLRCVHRVCVWALRLCAARRPRATPDASRDGSRIMHHGCGTPRRGIYILARAGRPPSDTKKIIDCHYKTSDVPICGYRSRLSRSPDRTETARSGRALSRTLHSGLRERRAARRGRGIRTPGSVLIPRSA